MPIVHLSDAQWNALSQHVRNHSAALPGLNAALAAPLPNLYDLIPKVQDTIDEVRARVKHPEEYDALSRAFHDAWLAWCRTKA